MEPSKSNKRQQRGEECPGDKSDARHLPESRGLSLLLSSISAALGVGRGAAAPSKRQRLDPAELEQEITTQQANGAAESAPSGCGLGAGTRRGGDGEEEPQLQKDQAAQLSCEQARGIDLVLKGYSIFFTGSAGTGKSFLLREIVRLLREIHGNDAVYVTASTGLAACNIGGCTLHSFAGVGLGELSQEHLLAKALSNKRTSERWISAKVLVIDEVSMLEGALFDKLEYLARKVRRHDAPFGGIQLVLSGDFFQLPPVQAKIFCFESEAWKKVVQRVVILDQVFRQSDNAFISLLNELRMGKVTEDGRRMLAWCMTPFHKRTQTACFSDDRIHPTLLYPHRKDVDEENSKRLAELPGRPRVYRAVDSGAEPYLSMLSRNCPAPSVLELKLESQVMLLKNLDSAAGLVNGARGVVVDFKRTARQDIQDESYDQTQEYPEVLFTSGVRRVMMPEEWSIEAVGVPQASRRQCPLTLAWALSIHKAQGMSISKVQMKLGSVWECGQAYVALSRATSMEGLYIVDLNYKSITAHPKVVQFHAALQVQQQEEAQDTV